MKVLKNNYKGSTDKIITNPYPRKFECENCQSELEYDESDIYIGVYGASHIECPLCGYENMLDGDEHDIILTKDNIEFPTHFGYHSVENGAVDTCNNEHVKKYVKEAIEYFRRNEDNDGYFYSGGGSTMVFVFKMNDDEEYEIVVTDKYYDTYIPFESEDL